MDRKELPFEPRYLGVPSTASKMISEAMVHLAQTVHLSLAQTVQLSWITISIISKQTEMSFHLSLIT
jgi:hypothetical protein